ncbi:hypothetical protein [Legionella hackeliae]|uniref:hypothetical protein n=1 Tax=Legionella hackeliae TaxID=449 RepID=UPI0005D3616C|nr:hypothetical protein [Legionella hackeliae]
MKIRSFVFVACFGLLSTAFAENHHFHASAETNETTFAPGPCEIEIVNDSFDDINIYGRFDDGTYLVPFTMKRWGEPNYISLFYYNSCHAGMDFYIETVDGKHKYNGFTPVGKTIRIKSY